jgi:cytochrome c553
MPFFSDKLFKFLLCTGLVVLFLIVAKNAYAPPPPPTIPTYTWSAHGNTSYGVNRSSIAAFGYSIGNCAHCHEQHASIGGSEPAPTGNAPLPYELFYTGLSPVEQTYFFCEYCHMDPNGPNQIQISMPPQYDYSRISGGDNNTCPNNIRTAFGFIADDCSGASATTICGSTYGSAHCLRDIVTFLSGTSWGFTSAIDPCSGCHNPHRAQQDTHATGRLQGQKLPGVVSLPSDHSKDNQAWKLWGDDLNERMSYYTSNYQAPCRYPHDPVTYPSLCESGYEPDGSITTNGSNMFDSVTFCLSCHQYNLPSTRIAALANKPPRQVAGKTNIIYWDTSTSGDEHGQKHDPNNWYLWPLKSPYTQGDSFNYVLSCLDCHEPHGSPNEYLIRQGINGKSGIVIPGPPAPYGSYDAVCDACHNVPHPGLGCLGCHYHGDPSAGGF